MESEEEIGKTATDYFRNLMNSNGLNKDNIKEITSAIQTKISDDQKRRLDRPFSREEVEVALKIINPTKAPGPDGAHAFMVRMPCFIKSSGMS